MIIQPVMLREVIKHVTTDVRIFVASRSLAGYPVFGGHHYLIIEVSKGHIPIAKLKDKTYQPKRLKLSQGGPRGYVVGAHKVKGLLKVKYFEYSDYGSYIIRHTQVSRSGYLVPGGGSLWGKRHEIFFLGRNNRQVMQKIITLVYNFDVNTVKKPIVYSGSGYNSNSWAQTVIKLAGGFIETTNLGGIDLSHSKSFPEQYFQEGIAKEKLPNVS